jgi:hypothetical protein
MEKRKLTDKAKASLHQFGLTRTKNLLPSWALSGWIGLFLFCSLFNSNAAFSGEGTGQEFRLNMRDKIFAAHHVDSNTCWAVGTSGLIIKSTDGGKTWEQRDKIGALSLFDIFFINGNKGWIVGDNGLILNTEDGGSSWKKQASGFSDSLMKVFFLDENRGVVLGVGGTVLYTENGGTLWQTYSIDWTSVLPEELMAKGVIAPNLYGIFFIDATHGWIVGDNGVLLKTSDGGKQWEVTFTGLPNSFYSIFFKNESEGWICGDSGLLIHTQDGGKNWIALKVPVKQNLFTINMAGASGFVTGEKAAVLQTADGRLTWSSLDLKLMGPLPYFGSIWITGNKAVFLGERIMEIPIQKTLIQ